MMHSRLLFLCLIVALACHPFSGFAASKLEEWTDPQGKKFRATPADVLGPFALFLTEKKAGKRLLLSQLSPQDCVRFAARLGDKPARARRWSEATGAITQDMVGNVRRVVGDAVVAADFSTMPEPEFIMIMFAWSGSDLSWQTFRDLIPEYERIQARFPHTFETLFVGVDHKENEHSLMARQLKMPWLVEDFKAGTKLLSIKRFAGKETPWMMIITRDGVPIASSGCKTRADMERACLEMEAWLVLMRPENKRAWPDRMHYYKAVRLASFRTGRADPMMIGHVVDLAGLRAAGITSVNAMLKVSAEGRVTSVSVVPGGGVDEKIGPELGAALLETAMVPAIENGEFVEGAYDLRLEP